MFVHSGSCKWKNNDVKGEGIFSVVSQTASVMDFETYFAVEALISYHHEWKFCCFTMWVCIVHMHTCVTPHIILKLASCFCADWWQVAITDKETMHYQGNAFCFMWEEMHSTALMDTDNVFWWKKMSINLVYKKTPQVNFLYIPVTLERQTDCWRISSTILNWLIRHFCCLITCFCFLCAKDILRASCSSFTCWAHRDTQAWFGVMSTWWALKMNQINDF